jgi:hypothetical protein
MSECNGISLTVLLSLSRRAHVSLWRSEIDSVSFWSHSDIIWTHPSSQSQPLDTPSLLPHFSQLLDFKWVQIDLKNLTKQSTNRARNCCKLVHGREWIRNLEGRCLSPAHYSLLRGREHPPLVRWAQVLRGTHQQCAKMCVVSMSIPGEIVDSFGRTPGSQALVYIVISFGRDRYTLLWADRLRSYKNTLAEHNHHSSHSPEWSP